MDTVKTAISIQGPLFKEINLLARRLKIPRSRLFTLAAEEFLKKHRNQELLQQINAVYADLNNQEDPRYLKRIKSKHRQVIKDEW